MPTNKMFTADPRITLPHRWLAASGAPSHITQGDLLLVAPTKKAAADLLVARGWSPTFAASAMRGGQVSGGNSVRALVDAGVVDSATPGVYAWSDLTGGRSVVRVGEDQTLTVVARLVHRMGGTTAEPVPATATS